MHRHVSEQNMPQFPHNLPNMRHFFLLFSVDYFITCMFKHKTALNGKYVNDHCSMQKTPAEKQMLQHQEEFSCAPDVIPIHFLVLILLPLISILKIGIIDTLRINPSTPIVHKLKD